MHLYGLLTSHKGYTCSTFSCSLQHQQVYCRCLSFWYPQWFPFWHIFSFSICSRLLSSFLLTAALQLYLCMNVKAVSGQFYILSAAVLSYSSQKLLASTWQLMDSSNFKSEEWEVAQRGSEEVEHVLQSQLSLSNSGCTTLSNQFLWVFHFFLAPDLFTWTQS